MFRIHAAIALAALSILSTSCKEGGAPGASAAVAVNTEDEKTLYALGLMVGRSLGPFGLTATELAIVQKGMTDSVTGATPIVKIEDYSQKVNMMGSSRQQAVESKKAEAEKGRSVAFLEKTA